MANNAYRFFLPAVVLAALLSGAAPASGGEAVLATHRSLYNFKMTSVDSGAGITDVNGKMYYEFDDVCDAWTTDQRFTLEYHYPERRPMETSSHFVSWESKDQNRFSFNSERQEGGETAELLRGSVERAGDGTSKADYVRPDDLSFDLPAGYLLPSGHTMEIIRHAEAGDRFFSAVLFDGTDAEGPVEINTFIGKSVTADEIRKIAADNAKIDVSLLSPKAWHVRMAVFPLRDKDNITPSYEMDLILHDNGVVSYSLVDYKTFKIAQILTALETIPAKNCSKR